MQPFFKKKFGYKLSDFPIAERYYQRAITLLLFPKMTDLNKLANLILKLTKGKSKVIHKPVEKRFVVSRRCANTHLAEKELGFKAKVDLSNGLLYTIRYLQGRT